MTTRPSFRESQLSQATRALFAFLFRNAVPADPAVVVENNDLALKRRRERALNGASLAVPTVFRPDDTPAVAGASRSSDAA